MTEPVPHPDPRPESAPIRLPLPRRAATPMPSSIAPESPAAARKDAGLTLAFGLQDVDSGARRVPVLGGLAVIFGIAALFNAPIALGPLAILFALGALLRGQAGLAAIGGISAVVALAISPVFWTVVGLAWLGSWLLG